jgi:hypothetical protein
MNEFPTMPGGTPGRYEARDVTRLGVTLVEVAWVPRGGPRGAALFAVTADRIPMIAAALGKYLAADLAPAGHLLRHVEQRFKLLALLAG